MENPDGFIDWKKLSVPREGNKKKTEVSSPTPFFLFFFFFFFFLTGFSPVRPPDERTPSPAQFHTTSSLLPSFSPVALALAKREEEEGEKRGKSSARVAAVM